MSKHRMHVRHWTSDVGKSFLVSFITTTSVNYFVISTERVSIKALSQWLVPLIIALLFISFCFALLCFIVFGSLPIFGYCLSVIEFSKYFFFLMLEILPSYICIHNTPYSQYVIDEGVYSFLMKLAYTFIWGITLVWYNHITRC